MVFWVEGVGSLQAGWLLFMTVPELLLRTEVIIRFNTNKADKFFICRQGKIALKGSNEVFTAKRDRQCLTLLIMGDN